MFLSKEAEIVLQDCIDHEHEFIAMLANKLNALKSYEEKRKFRSIIDELTKNEYIVVQWSSDIPFIGHITQSGKDYFRSKDIYIRHSLREHSVFSLGEESENTLNGIIQLISSNGNNQCQISERNGYSLESIQNLIDYGLIRTSKRGIIKFLPQGFVVIISLTQRGKTYFSEKDKYIEEILMLSPLDNFTRINIFNGDNSPLQFGNVNCTQTVEYNFEIAQKALDELMSKIDELGLTAKQQQAVKKKIKKAQRHILQKKSNRVKSILKGILSFLKDVGCSIISGLILSNIGL